MFGNEHANVLTIGIEMPLVYKPEPAVRISEESVKEPQKKTRTGKSIKNVWMDQVIPKQSKMFIKEPKVQLKERKNISMNL